MAQRWSRDRWCIVSPYKDPARQRAYQAAWIKRRREAWLAENGPCVRCGSSEGLVEVDHVDPSEKVSHRIWSGSAKRRESELAKCQVLCGACHLEKSRVDLSRIGTKPTRHGTTYAYKDKGCRCDLCVHAYRTAKRRWNATQRDRRPA